MNFMDAWEKALKETKIIRPRVKSLETFEATNLPYVLLSPSVVNVGDTVERKGEIRVDKPAVFLASGSPQFEGFEFNADTNFSSEMFANMLLVRGVMLPSLRYANHQVKLDVTEGEPERVSEGHLQFLHQREDVVTTLLAGPDECWQLSLMIFIAGQVARSVEGDVQKLLERYRHKKWF